MKRAQTEIFGLTFVVLIILVALMFYLSLSSSSNSLKIIQQEIAQANLYGKSLETAILKTTLLECGYSFETALRQCTTKPYLTCGSSFSSKNICELTHTAWLNMLSASLDDQGILYRAQILSGNAPLFVQGYSFEHEPEPQECNANSNIYAGPTQPIPTTTGDLQFVIEFC